MVISTTSTATKAELSQEKERSAQTLKAVQVQVAGGDNQRVDLRLIERSGALTVSVRSPDSSLTKALQQNLPELSSKLNDQHVHAEWWTPDTQKIGTARNSADASSDSGSDHSASRDQTGQEKGQPRQQGGRGAPQPDWVEQLSNLRNSNQDGPQYTWHL
jgi:hypothetical protein